MGDVDDRTGVITSVSSSTLLLYVVHIGVHIIEVELFVKIIDLGHIQTPQQVDDHLNNDESNELGDDQEESVEDAADDVAEETQEEASSDISY